MTKEEFSQLPLLLSQKQFLAATGFSKSLFDELVRVGEIRSYKPKVKKRYWVRGGWRVANACVRRFYKADAARLCGLTF